MIDDVLLKGIVVNIGRYAVALLFRLAFYRHPDLLPNPFTELQDTTGFVTFKVPQRNLGKWMHGFLHSRDYEESLADFHKNARGGDLLVPQTLDPSELYTPVGHLECYHFVS